MNFSQTDHNPFQTNHLNQQSNAGLLFQSSFKDQSLHSQDHSKQKPNKFEILNKEDLSTNCRSSSLAKHSTSINPITSITNPFTSISLPSRDKRASMTDFDLLIRNIKIDKQNSKPFKRRKLTSEELLLERLDKERQKLERQKKSHQMHFERIKRSSYKPENLYNKDLLGKKRLLESSSQDDRSKDSKPRSFDRGNSHNYNSSLDINPEIVNLTGLRESEIAKWEEYFKRVKGRKPSNVRK